VCKGAAIVVWSIDLVAVPGLRLLEKEGHALKYNTPLCWHVYKGISIVVWSIARVEGSALLVTSFLGAAELPVGSQVLCLACPSHIKAY
jgi:hypothetical protein